MHRYPFSISFLSFYMDIIGVTSKVIPPTPAYCLLHVLKTFPPGCFASEMIVHGHELIPFPEPYLVWHPRGIFPGGKGEVSQRRRYRKIL